MNFISKLFVLFVAANIFSVNFDKNIALATENSDLNLNTEISINQKLETKEENQEKNQEEINENHEKDSQENEKYLKQEPKKAGSFVMHSEYCAYSYELDKDGNIKNLKDLLASDTDSEEANKNENESKNENTNDNKAENTDNKNSQVICVYSSYARFEVFSDNYGNFEIKRAADKF